MKKPFLHALSAAAYIALIVFIMSSLESSAPKEDNIAMPMLFLSVLVLSVAIMGFLFFYEPLRLYIDNQKKEALVFFGRTVAAFACFVALFLIFIFLI